MAACSVRGVGLHRRARPGRSTASGLMHPLRSRPSPQASPASPGRPARRSGRPSAGTRRSASAVVNHSVGSPASSRPVPRARSVSTSPGPPTTIAGRGVSSGPQANRRWRLVEAGAAGAAGAGERAHLRWALGPARAARPNGPVRWSPGAASASSSSTRPCGAAKHATEAPTVPLPMMAVSKTVALSTGVTVFVMVVVAP